MIAAFDLATRIGWCCGAGDDTPAIGSKQLDSSGVEIGPYLLEFHDWANTFIDERAPDIVVFEAPILAKKTNISTTRKLQGLAGVLEMICARRLIDCREVSIQDGRKALTGNAHAKKPEETVPAAIAYGLAIKVHDEADAFGVWLAAIRALRPEHRDRWLPLLFGKAIRPQRAAA